VAQLFSLGHFTPQMNKTEIMKFSDHVLASFLLIRQGLENEKSLLETNPPPQDWSEIQSILRIVADDLRLCADADEAIRRLLLDLKAARTVWFVASKLTPVDARKLIRLAQSKTHYDFSTLPLTPLADFLIEICNGLDPAKLR
jgi:hypothetical protein